nr:reverse transcriptase domain-containing protein [Tanacetum cinerariifolium]
KTVTIWFTLTVLSALRRSSNENKQARSNRRRVPNTVEPEIRTIEEIVPMADRTMEELLQAPTEGYGEAIVILKILAENFVIKTNLLLEAWDGFKEMLRACPHHGFSELTQIDTFYNGLTEQDHDSLNAAAGGNRLNKTTREALKIIENKSKVCDSRSKLNVSRVNTNSRHNVTVEKTCVTCGGAHAYYDCIATDSTLSSNTVPNPKGEIKAVTTRSGLAYEGLSIPTNFPFEKVDEQNTKQIMDKEHSNCPGGTTQVQPPVMPISISKPDVLRTQTKPTIPYLSRLNDQKLREKATNQMEKFFQIFHDLHFDISFADALLLMPKFASTIKTDQRVSLILGRSFLRTDHALIDVHGEEITLRYNPKSSNPTLVSDALIPERDFSKEPIVKSFSPTLTPFGESDFFLEEIEDFLNDDSIPTGIENSVSDPEGDILFS